MIGTASSAPASTAALRTISTSAVAVEGEAVESDHDGDAEELHVLDLLGEVLAALLESGVVLGLEQLRVDRQAAVHLEGAHGAGDDHATGREAAVAADDVHELLGAQVGAEAGLGDDVVGQLHGDLVGDDRVVALRDVGERPGVDEARVALEGLHEVRLERVLEEDGHRAGRLDVLGGQRLAVGAVAEGDASETLAQVLERRGETEDGHDLAGHRDVVAGLTREAVELAAQPDDDVAQGAVVQVDDAPPRDGERVDLAARCRA